MQQMQIQGTEIQIKEYQGKRVVTLKDVDAPYVEFGTGPTGQAHHNGISPDVDPVYSQSGWMIPADAMSPDDAEQYGFGIAKGKDGEVIGYYTKGQVAQPFMYPAFAELKDDVTQEIKAALEKDLKKVTR